MIASNPIPLIDLKGSTPEQLAQRVGHAVQSVGFLHVKGLGISSEQVGRMFKMHEELFGSHVEDLEACSYDGKNGFMAPGRNRLDESKTLPGDIKSSFVYGREYPSASGVVQSLPLTFQRNKEEIDAFHKACYEATCVLLDAFSVALNLPITYFRDCHWQGACGMAMINYPGVIASDAPEGTGVARASAHKDWGSVTLLFQEQSGTPGLEIFHDGKWWPAPLIPDTVLVNVGLAIELWTGGLLKATLHRVVTHPLPEGGFKGRRSIAYFVQPKDEVVFNKIAADGTIEKNETAMTSKEFFMVKLSASTVKVN